jgi:hypothetical protein
VREILGDGRDRQVPDRVVPPRNRPSRGSLSITTRTKAR